jgi:hypothetical protein
LNLGGSIVLFPSGVTNYASITLNSGFNDFFRGATNPTAQLSIVSGTKVIVAPRTITLAESATPVIVELSLDADNKALFASGLKVSVLDLIGYSFYRDGVLTAAVKANETTLIVENTIVTAPGNIILPQSDGMFPNTTEYVAIELSNAVFRPDLTVAQLQSGITFSTGVASQIALAQNFTVVGYNSTRSVLVIKTSGALTASSGAISISPSVYNATAASPAVLSSSGITTATYVNTAASSQIISSGLDNSLRLELNNGIFLPEASLNSGMFVFAGNLLGANSDALLGSGSSFVIKRVTDSVVVITANSGMLELSGTVLITSGAFISTSDDAPTVTPQFSRVQVYSGLITAGGTASHKVLTISLPTAARFKTNADGFNPSLVTFTGSGLTTTDELANARASANTVASIIQAELLNGNYTISNNTLVITLKTDLAIVNNSIIITVSPDAILTGDTAAARSNLVTFGRA